MACPAGLGALAMTVRPPPVTAPATTACFNASVNPGASVARYVIAALSLKLVRIVSNQTNRGTRPRLLGTGFDPPSLQPAVNDQARKKETDEKRRPEIEFLLIVGRGLGKRQKEQKASDEKRRAVRDEHDKRHEGDLRPDEPQGNVGSAALRL